MGPNKIPYIVTNDGRTIRFPHPDVHIGDTVKKTLQSTVGVTDSARKYLVTGFP